VSRARPRPRILGLDPGFASFGWAVVEIGRRRELDVPVALGVIETEKSAKGAGARVVDDHVRRMRTISQVLAYVQRMHGPFVVAGAESFSPPRSSSVAAKVAFAWGVLVHHLDVAGTPLLQVSPQEVKLALTGERSASKVEIIERALALYGAPAARLLEALRPKDLHEHAADAMAVTIACADAELVRLARQM
jgi:Holliday junction resolvasome RuvABC endonuclease subunit